MNIRTIKDPNRKLLLITARIEGSIRLLGNYLIPVRVTAPSKCVWSTGLSAVSTLPSEPANALKKLGVFATHSGNFGTDDLPETFGF